MGLIRTVLRPAARVAAAQAGREARRFMDAHDRTEQVQDELLMRLVRSAAETEFGRDHGLAGVRSYADFASAVPIRRYEELCPYVQRVLEGHTEALFAPGTEVLMFAVTSGTTGPPKHIPVTRRFLNDYRRGWNIFGVRMLRDHPDAWLRKIVTISSSARESASPTGVPCGAVSGMLAETQKWIVRRMYPVPRAVANIHDPVGKFYTIMRSAVAHDVGVLTTANPSSAVMIAQVGRDHCEQIIRDVRDGTLTGPGGRDVCAEHIHFRPDPAGARRLEAIVSRHGELIPRHFWNLSCLTMWTGGTVRLYLPQVRELYGDVPIRDIGLLASEGRMSIPLADGTAGGVAEITSNFLEFIPVEEAGSASPSVLRAHEVEVAREYLIVLTNWAGLWRYHIDDRVRVIDRLGSSPVIEFLSRGGHASSITGEKLTEHQVVGAMDRARADVGGGVEVFTLQGHFANPPYYELVVEGGSGVGAPPLIERMDAELRRLNVEYDGKRGSGRLGPMRVSYRPAGSFARQQAEQLALRRGRAEQYKHQYLLTEIVNDAGGASHVADGSA